MREREREREFKSSETFQHLALFGQWKNDVLDIAWIISQGCCES